MNEEELIKLIDKKIERLTKEEKPEELLKRALIKKNIIKKNDNLTEKQINNIFEMIKNNLDK